MSAYVLAPATLGQRLRSIVFVLVLSITVIPYAFAVLALLAVSVQWRYRAAAAWLRLAINAARAICGVRYEVRGLAVLDQLARSQTPVILALKHQSTWETFAMPALVPRQLCYVFKKSLLRIPFFGWAMGTLRMIHIDRSKRAEAFAQVVEQGTARLAEGRWIIMFPEGTRTPVGARGNYKAGAARLALRTGVAVVPIAVNAGECWPRKSMVLRPGLVTVSVGAPIASAGRTPEQLTDAVEHWIEAEMRALSPHVYAQG